MWLGHMPWINVVARFPYPLGSMACKFWQTPISIQSYNPSLKLTLFLQTEIDSRRQNFLSRQRILHHLILCLSCHLAHLGFSFHTQDAT